MEQPFFCLLDTANCPLGGAACRASTGPLVRLPAGHFSALNTLSP